MQFFPSPLEQFQVTSLVNLSFFSLNMSFTNSAFFMVLAVATILTFMRTVTANGGFILPTAWQSLAEMIYDFVKNLVKEQIGKPGKKYFPIVFTTFTYILTINLIGMIPYSFTPTSHFIVTFSLSFSLFFGITCIGFLHHGLHFFSFLLPPGAPLGLAPFLVLMELVSYCFRAISLGVRLFANMMAGHTLVKILSGFSWSMMKLGGIMLFVSLVPLTVVFALTFLEVGVGCLQAYVFSILVCIYLSDVIYLH